VKNYKHIYYVYVLIMSARFHNCKSISEAH